MIKSVHIQNFECHKDSVLEFSDGLNVITGNSGYGKSSIIRAINWVLTNKPSGNSMIPHNQKSSTKTSVKLVFDDGRYIIREKKSGENGYIVFDGKKKHRFKALRSNVPDMVTEIANMGESNVQLQKDFYFLLNDSPGQVAKKLNEVVGLDEMDKALEEANKRTRKFSWNISQYEEKLEKVVEEVESLEWVYSADKDLSKIEELEEEVSSHKSDIQSVQKIIREVFHYRKVLQNFTDPSVLDEISKIDQLMGKIEDLEDDQAEVVELVRLLKSYLSKRKGIRVPNQNVLKNLTAKINEIEQEQNRLFSLNSAVREIKLLEDRFEIVTASMDRLDKEYHKLLRKHGICPTCGRKM